MASGTMTPEAERTGGFTGVRGTRSEAVARAARERSEQERETQRLTAMGQGTSPRSLSAAAGDAATGGPSANDGEPLVRVDDLTVDYRNDDQWVSVVKDVSFEIGRGETLGLAGESGCGKTTTALAMFGYNKAGSRVAGGRVTFDGRDLLGLSDRQMQPIRGARISLVPQNPASTLTPSMKVGRQVVETLEGHGVSSGGDAMDRTVQLFGQVGLPEPAKIARRYPHQLSGGQQQRVVIAIAIACRPDLIVLDEPTTALDVTTQARLLDLLTHIKADSGMSALYVSHNLGVLEQICDRVAVMYAGELIEIAPTAELFNRPRHPYTRGLIAAVPRVEAEHAGTEKLRGLLRRDDLPDGCGFAPRCPYSRPQCFTDRQRLAEIEPSHQVACWRAPDIEAEAGAP